MRREICLTSLQIHLNSPNGQILDFNSVLLNCGYDVTRIWTSMSVSQFPTRVPYCRLNELSTRS